jgi:pilus assembly protein FimV
MKLKHSAVVVSTLFATLFSATALAATQAEAHAQLDTIPTAEVRTAAREVLDTLVASGVSVDNALTVVTAAVDQNFTAGQLLQVGDQVQTQSQQNIPADQIYAQVNSEVGAGITGNADDRSSTAAGAAQTGSASGQFAAGEQTQTGRQSVSFQNPGSPANAGNPGMAGAPGSFGAPGMTGTPGAAGTPMAGAPGVVGALGSAGAPGMAGAPGANGSGFGNR